MKNTALILHGWGGGSEENWFPWLKNKLEQRAFEVFVPNLPNTDNPIIEEQLEYIEVYSSDFSDGGYIICHSLGCQLALKFIEENNIKNSKIILVGPTYLNLAEEIIEALGDCYSILNIYFNLIINFEKINKLNNQFIIFLSDNDSYINMENAKKYYSNLDNIKFLEFEKKGHFNQDAGVLELEEILTYIK